MKLRLNEEYEIITSCGIKIGWLSRGETTPVIDCPKEIRDKIEKQADEIIKKHFQQMANVEIEVMESLNQKEKIDHIWNAEIQIRMKLLEAACLVDVDTNIIMIEKSNHDYYSFIRVYDEKGKCCFSLPFEGLEYLESYSCNGDFEKEIVYIREPENEDMSNNGGDYYAGYEVSKITENLYSVRYNGCLHSDFEAESWDNQGLFSKTELSKFLSRELSSAIEEAI